MKNVGKFIGLTRWLFLIAIVCFINGCETGNNNPGDSTNQKEVPDFITSTEDYFFVSIGEIPSIDASTFHLTISGTNTPASYSLDALRSLAMKEKTLTIECIGNTANGPLLGTATWKGFRIYDLLNDLGIQEGSTHVKYICADGYYTYNSLDELQNHNVIGALYMNGDPIPAKYGFPLRIIFPGYYGVRQPGWITEIEVANSPVVDYWTKSGWSTDSSMAVDSKIFLPKNNSLFTLGETIRITGAAYGGKRISSVEITADDGITWFPTLFIQKLDEDYVWVFWEAYYTPTSTGDLTLRSRATGQDGSIQPRDDSDYLDGTNSWPEINLIVIDGG